MKIRKSIKNIASKIEKPAWIATVGLASLQLFTALTVPPLAIQGAFVAGALATTTKSLSK